MKNFIITNGIENTGNRGNCFPLALAAVTGYNYLNVEEFCRVNFGYDEVRGGCYIGDPIKTFKLLQKGGYISKKATFESNFRYFSGRSMSARKFIESNPAGVWVLVTRGHGFAYVNGKVINNGYLYNDAQSALKANTLKGQYIAHAYRVDCAS